MGIVLRVELARFATPTVGLRHPRERQHRQQERGADQRAADLGERTAPRGVLRDCTRLALEKLVEPFHMRVPTVRLGFLQILLNRPHAQILGREETFQLLAGIDQTLGAHPSLLIKQHRKRQLCHLIGHAQLGR